MAASKTVYAEMLEKPQYENVRTILRSEIMPTRQLHIITSSMVRAQQQIAARHNDGAFFSGENSLPIEGLLFVAPSGAGKSFGIKYATHTLPDIELFDGSKVPCYPLLVDTPFLGTVSALAGEIVRCADGPEMRPPKDKEALGKVISALARHRFTLVAIDEISRIINPERHTQAALAAQSHLVWSMFIEALNLATSPTPIVTGGLPHVLDSFTIIDRKEEARKTRWEAKRRMKVVRLPDLTLAEDEDMLRGAIQTYCDIAGVESKLKEDDHIVPRLLHASLYQAGAALEWIQKAVALAKVRPRGKLDREDFAYVYGDMTSAGRGANPFLASGWDRINIGKVAPRNYAEAVDEGNA